MNLSPHFTLQELTASQIADRAGIDNTPDEEHIGNLILLCTNVLEPLRDELGPIIMSSGYRCLSLNRRIGSKDTSYHVQGRAGDIKVRGVSPIDICKTIVRLNLPCEEIINEFGDYHGRGWCHVAVSLHPRIAARRQMTIDRHGIRSGFLEARP